MWVVKRCVLCSGTSCHEGSAFFGRWADGDGAPPDEFHDDRDGHLSRRKLVPSVEVDNLPHVGSLNSW